MMLAEEEAPIETQNLYNGLQDADEEPPQLQTAIATNGHKHQNSGLRMERRPTMRARIETPVSLLVRMMLRSFGQVVLLSRELNRGLVLKRQMVLEMQQLIAMRMMPWLNGR